jgi:hypothetical protein
MGYQQAWTPQSSETERPISEIATRGVSLICSIPAGRPKFVPIRFYFRESFPLTVISWQLLNRACDDQPGVRLTKAAPSRAAESPSASDPVVVVKEIRGKAAKATSPASAPKMVRCDDSKFQKELS